MYADRAWPEGPGQRHRAVGSARNDPPGARGRPEDPRFLKETTMGGKYIILIGDGMADWPIPAIGNRTPLEAAEKPNMDFMAANGAVGMVQVVPEEMYPVSYTHLRAHETRHDLVCRL